MTAIISVAFSLWGQIAVLFPEQFLIKMLIHNIDYIPIKKKNTVKNTVPVTSDYSWEPFFVCAEFWAV